MSTLTTDQGNGHISPGGFTIHTSCNFLFCGSALICYCLHTGTAGHSLIQSHFLWRINFSPVHLVQQKACVEMLVVVGAHENGDMTMVLLVDVTCQSWTYSPWGRQRRRGSTGGPWVSSSWKSSTAQICLTCMYLYDRYVPYQTGWCNM